MKRLIFTVTNDLTYDQRMHRICSSLSQSNYDVLLIGRRLPDSIPLKQKGFKQKRIRCAFNKGFLFYAEYNIRLFFSLLFLKMDALCAVDLDTIIPCYFTSVLRNKKRVYDAHELFTEQKEIITRPLLHKFWLALESFTVPKFIAGYTVNQFIANELKRRYTVDYKIVRNLPEYYSLSKAEEKKIEKFIIYQGAVNEGRSFETLIPAMKEVNAKLIICGNGNYFKKVQSLIHQNRVENKVELKGFVEPEKLKHLTPKAHIAVMIFEATGLNQYYSLSNRFFDYVMACVPQVCVAFPEYKAINDTYNIAYLVSDVEVETIATALNNLIFNDVVHEQLKTNCLKAREVLNWEKEKDVLINFYKLLLA